MKTNPRALIRRKRKARIRKKITGTTERPRLSIFLSSRYIYTQIIDDTQAKTVCAGSSLEKDLKAKFKGHANKDVAKEIGKLIAERAQAKNIKSVVFDRNGNRYSGKVRVLAESAREAGLQF